MDRIRKVALNGSKVLVPASGKAASDNRILQETICHGFWFNFFAQNCQRPNNHLRLFPTNRSFRFIYDYYFLSWFEKQHPPSGEDGQRDDDDPVVPSFSTFYRARYHKKFKDVQTRPRHYHAICQDCENLMTRRLKGFADSSQSAAWEALFEAHELNYLGWRDHEYCMLAWARAGPKKVLFLSYDDTSALGLPKLGNRDPKNLGKSRFDVIPFNITNNTTNESTYVYTVKAGWEKGANRLCSVLYHYLRKIKFSGGDSAQARVLILHADNYSENKNNYMFQFACELVYKGWFDEIRLEYGPPGHTHNNNDAVHAIHNCIAGNFTSFTLGQFVQSWASAWRVELNLPTAVVQDVQYNFKKRYTPTDHTQKEGLRRLAGFTNSGQHDDIVGAFKFAWSAHTKHTVEVTWKKAASDAQWRGADKEPLSPGFVIMQCPPIGRPSVVKPKTTKTPAKYVNELCGTKMRRQAEAHLSKAEAAEAMEWLRMSAVEQKMPYTLLPAENQEDCDPRGTWGPKIEIGVADHKAGFFLMQADADEKDDFWALPPLPAPQAAEAEQVQHQLSEHLLALPDVRYSDDARQQTAPRAEDFEQRHAGLESRLHLEPSQRQEVPPSYGAPVGELETGIFAVVDVLFNDSRGIELVKVKEIVTTAEDDEYPYATFKGNSWQLKSGAQKVTKGNRECLDCAWFPSKKSSSTTYNTWWVLLYVSGLTKEGKLKAADKRKLLAKIDEQNVGTFKPVNVSVLSDDDHVLDENAGYEDDDDEDDSESHVYINKKRQRTDARV